MTDNGSYGYNTVGGRDTVLRGLLLDGSVNMTAISGKQLVEAARQAHGLSHVCTAALGRLLMQTAMMSVQLKNASDNLTVILDGDGAAGRFVAVGKEGGRVKGYADLPDVKLPLKDNGKLDVSGAVGQNGELRVIRDLSLKEPYVGRCAITDGEIANDFANYFVVSEQQPSLVYLGVRVDPATGAVRAASGLMLQPLPFCPEADIAAIEERAGEITRLTRMLEEGASLEEAIDSVLGGLRPEITESIEPSFVCDCSRQKIESALISLGRAELSDMIEKDGGAELKCRFCNRTYNFTKDELVSLLNEAAEESGADD
ncbi:MAG: Hsp33 family molecular chaperone HslO [Clostridia bacterium]|nr:Hsp33 family molecular chaperone HslO [Clostridia bacterium]